MRDDPAEHRVGREGALAVNQPLHPSGGGNFVVVDEEQEAAARLGDGHVAGNCYVLLRLGEIAHDAWVALAKLPDNRFRAQLGIVVDNYNLVVGRFVKFLAQQALQEIAQHVRTPVRRDAHRIYRPLISGFSHNARTSPPAIPSYSRARGTTCRRTAGLGHELVNGIPIFCEQ